MAKYFNFEGEENICVPRRVFRERRNPLDTLGDEQFIAQYKFDRQSVYELAERLQLGHSTFRSCAIPSVLQLLITLRYYATGTFQSVIADGFNIHKSTVCRTVHRVSNAIVTKLLNSVVCFPTRQEEDAIAEHFFNYSGFPKVCGVIDGTHVQIQAPTEHEDQFVNRKNYHSINVQIVCNHVNKITNVVAKWPGSTHDARILDESRLAHEFQDGSHKGLLLGDSGYPCRSWLMTPFRHPANRPQASIGYLRPIHYFDYCFEFIA